MIVLTVLVGLSSLLVLPVACRPISYMWKGWGGTRQAKCINMNAETFVYAALNMALDIIVFLMPVPQVSVSRPCMTEAHMLSVWIRSFVSR
jgi:hypothetical protein